MKSRQTQEVLIVFTRHPEPGTTKTRLAKALGDRGAAAMQKKLTELTMTQVKQFLQLRQVPVHIYHEGGSLEQMRHWLGPAFIYQAQAKGDLGQRLHGAAAEAFNQGFTRVIIIGTDCPGLLAEHLVQAFAALQHSDLVIGPAADGGYYLIGLRLFSQSLFEKIPWSTKGVLAKTLAIAEKQDLSTYLLAILHDVDRPEDLKHIKPPAAIPSEGHAINRESTGCSCSIIIPTLNEADTISRLLPKLLAAPDVELLVVDGGSTDNTVAVAEALGAQVLQASPGRAAQMNAGAKAARGEILLFLHADTDLAPGFVDPMRDALGEPGVAAGAFRLAIAGGGVGLRVIEWLANCRSRLLQMPYGDQGIFMTAEMFSKAGGFPLLPIMEDFEMLRRLKRKGSIRILPLSATTASRRWNKLGLLQTTLINQIIIIAYLLGVKPQKLAEWYRKG